MAVCKPTVKSPLNIYVGMNIAVANANDLKAFLFFINCGERRSYHDYILRSGQVFTVTKVRKVYFEIDDGAMRLNRKQFERYFKEVVNV